MNREDILKLAREAGVHPEYTPGMLEMLTSFSALVAAEERKKVRASMKRALKRMAGAIRADERESIMDEWWMCVQSDLENGVKSLNERAAEKWHKEYPAIAGFDAAIRARGQV